MTRDFPFSKEFWEAAYGPPEFHILKKAAEQVLLVHNAVGDDPEGAFECALQELQEAVDTDIIDRFAAADGLTREQEIKVLAKKSGMNPLKHLKRFLVDAVGNYLFFAPLVIGLTPALRSVHAAEGYLIAAVPIALLGSRAYVLFLKLLWYPLMKEEF